MQRSNTIDESPQKAPWKPDVGLNIQWLYFHIYEANLAGVVSIVKQGTFTFFRLYFYISYEFCLLSLQMNWTYCVSLPLFSILWVSHSLQSKNLMKNIHYFIHDQWIHMWHPLNFPKPIPDQCGNGRNGNVSFLVVLMLRLVIFKNLFFFCCQNLKTFFFQMNNLLKMCKFKFCIQARIVKSFSDNIVLLCFMTVYIMFPMKRHRFARFAFNVHVHAITLHIIACNELRHMEELQENWCQCQYDKTKEFDLRRLALSDFDAHMNTTIADTGTQIAHEYASPNTQRVWFCTAQAARIDVSGQIQWTVSTVA